MMISRMTCALVGAALLACGSVAGPASATLTLTPTGIADGFTLTTFATFPPSGCCSGPFGMAVTNNGNVIVSLGSGPLYVFPNVDGQSPGTALFTQSSNSGTAGYATAGGQAYGWQSSQFVQFKNDGTVDHVLTGVTPGPYLGAWGNPVTVMWWHRPASASSTSIPWPPVASARSPPSALAASSVTAIDLRGWTDRLLRAGLYQRLHDRHWRAGRLRLRLPEPRWHRCGHRQRLFHEKKKPGQLPDT